MSGSAGVLLAAASTLAQVVAGWAAVLPVAGLAIYGWSRGAFLATIAALQVLAAFLAAVAAARPVATVLGSLGCPAAHAPALAFVLVFLVVVGGVRVAVAAAVPEGACRLGPIVDKVAGVLAGAAGGFVLGGAILVGWSMADLSPGLRVAAAHLPVDSGASVLRVFARFVGRAASPADLLFEGDRPAADPLAAGVVRASEPFADANGNGAWDAGAEPAAGGEPYLDVDGNGSFTRDLAWDDARGDGRRTTGLHDCYRLAEWSRVRAMHAPRIESAATAEVIENAPVEEIVYQARATDADGDAVTFGVEPADLAEGAVPGVAIDPQSGAVTLVERADFERTPAIEFVVVATDATGQSTRTPVRLRVRDVLLEPESPP